MIHKILLDEKLIYKNMVDDPKKDLDSNKSHNEKIINSNDKEEITCAEE